MTNVKPGDVAQVVKATPAFAWTLGRVVTIAGPCGCAEFWANNGAAFWRFEDELCCDGKSTKCAADQCLKRLDPLTDPDAVPRVRDLELTP